MSAEKKEKKGRKMIINIYTLTPGKKKSGEEYRRYEAYADGNTAKFIIEEATDKNAWRPENLIVYISTSENVFNNQRSWDRREVGRVNTINEAKKFIQKYCSGSRVEHDNDERSSGVIKYLPAGDNTDFYPTPSKLAGRMLACVDWKKVTQILEPSAGKGNLIEATKCMVESTYQEFKFVYEMKRDVKSCFDVIETDMDLRLLLRAQGYRLVAEDFLDFHTNKRYDLILMNPPFSNGATHLLKAISLQQNGGQIVCLLNAETIRNPYTNERKLLKSKLAEYAAKIEFVKGAFRHAERKSDVEVAIVYINIPVKFETNFDFLGTAKKAVEADVENAKDEPKALVIGDEVLAMIENYNVEAKAGIELMKAYDKLAPYIRRTSETGEPLIQLSIAGSSQNYTGISNEAVNQYLRELRGKYWQALLNRPSLQEKMTSQMSSDFSAKLREMKEYEFDKHNVMQVLFDLQLQLAQGVEDSIMRLFDQLSAQYAWFSDGCENIHYYNGWKTNKAHKVNFPKVILPIRGFSSYSWEKDKLDEYDVVRTIADLERALTYLDKGEIGWRRDPFNVIRNANQMGSQKSELDFTYFSAKFYKKGTCHIKFLPSAKPIIERLNIFAARQRSWLPPTYGKKSYRDMTEEEKNVVDEFQGAEEYAKVMSDPGQYILDRGSLQPMLSA